MASRRRLVPLACSAALRSLVALVVVRGHQSCGHARRPLALIALAQRCLCCRTRGVVDVAVIMVVEALLAKTQGPTTNGKRIVNGL